MCIRDSPSGSAISSVVVLPPYWFFRVGLGDLQSRSWRSGSPSKIQSSKSWSGFSSPTASFLSCGGSCSLTLSFRLKLDWLKQFFPYFLSQAGWFWNLTPSLFQKLGDSIDSNFFWFNSSIFWLCSSFAFYNSSRDYFLSYWYSSLAFYNNL